MDGVEIARWVAAAVLFAGSSVVIVGNGWILVSGLLLRRETRSWIPLLGGILGALAFLMAPNDKIRSLWWLPFVLDFGSVPGLACTAACFAWEAVRRRVRR